MPEKRLGSQTPTRSYILPYTDTEGAQAIELYNKSKRTAQPWQELIMYDMLAKNDDGLWVHVKFGYSVPRRNGKNEIVVMRELYGLKKGEQILHTAHRTTTSSSAAQRLADLLNELGYEEVQRPQKGKKYTKGYTFAKQLGNEKITLLKRGGGSCSFRTRSGKGGLGEGFDLLVIDEAQEYQDDQESALKYVVSDSKNPQTVFLGTPPTAVSSGTIFTKMRTAILSGTGEDSGWAEWSVPHMTDVHDTEAWYTANPSLGTILTERKIKAEIGPDKVDFNIQRLGLWLQYNQKSAITPQEWQALQTDTAPKVRGKLYVGIKYNSDGASVSMAIAVQTEDEKAFIEAIDCRPVRAGNGWILQFLSAAKDSIAAILIDGASGQMHLAAEMTEAGIKKKPKLPTVKEIIEANTTFESAVYDETICHLGQPSLTKVVTNCEKRAIGSNGGFGYRSIKDGADISLMDSCILAHYALDQAMRKPIRKQTVNC